MKQIIPAATIPTSPSPPPPSTYSWLNVMLNQDAGHTLVTAASVAANTHIRPSEEIIYKKPKREPFREDAHNDDDYDEEILEEDGKNFGRENVCSVANALCLQQAVS